MTDWLHVLKANGMKFSGKAELINFQRYTLTESGQRATRSVSQNAAGT
ncbi:hypothetical protein [Komagataeibacter saccharivorans]|nr:hypothetical protein [Komagataeibacter saccharivorans]